MTVKKYCEENNLDPNKVFDMVLGESGSILPKARGFTGYIVEIKDNCLSCTNDKFNVFNKDKTLWENYSPEGLGKGNPAKADFVGWTGLVPISIFFEYVLGIKADVPNNKIVWHINKLEKHGILNYPFGNDGVINLICEARNSNDEEPIIKVESNKPIQIEISYNNKIKLFEI